jgi:hypothetical protein
MKEPYIEGVAIHDGPESCADGREDGGEALTGVRTGAVLSREIRLCRDADVVKRGGRLHLRCRYREASWGPARSKTRCMCGTFLSENREIPRSPAVNGRRVATGSPKDVIRRHAYPPPLAIFRTFEAYAFTPKTPGFVGLEFLPALAPVGAGLWLALLATGLTDPGALRRGLAVVVATAFLPLLVIFVYSFRQPVYLAGRTDAYLFPLFAVGCAVGLERLRGLWRRTPTLAVIVLGGLSAASLTGAVYRFEGNRDREAALWVADRAGEDDTVILCGSTALTLDYHLRERLPDIPRRYFPSYLETEFSIATSRINRDTPKRLAGEVDTLERLVRARTGGGRSLWIAGVRNAVSGFLLAFFLDRGWKRTGASYTFRTAKQNFPAVAFELTLP